MTPEKATPATYCRLCGGHHRMPEGGLKCPVAVTKRKVSPSMVIFGVEKVNRQLGDLLLLPIRGHKEGLSMSVFVPNVVRDMESTKEKIKFVKGRLADFFSYFADNNNKFGVALKQKAAYYIVRRVRQTFDPPYWRWRAEINDSRVHKEDNNFRFGPPFADDDKRLADILLPKTTKNGGRAMRITVQVSPTDENWLDVLWKRLHAFFSSLEGVAFKEDGFTREALVQIRSRTGKRRAFFISEETGYIDLEIRLRGTNLPKRMLVLEPVSFVHPAVKFYLNAFDKKAVTVKQLRDIYEEKRVHRLHLSAALLGDPEFQKKMHGVIEWRLTSTLIPDFRRMVPGLLKKRGPPCEFEVRRRRCRLTEQTLTVVRLKLPRRKIKLVREFDGAVQDLDSTDSESWSEDCDREFEDSLRKEKIAVAAFVVWASQKHPDHGLPRDHWHCALLCLTRRLYGNLPRRILSFLEGRQMDFGWNDPEKIFEQLANMRGALPHFRRRARSFHPLVACNKRSPYGWDLNWFCKMLGLCGRASLYRLGEGKPRLAFECCYRHDPGFKRKR